MCQLMKTTLIKQEIALLKKQLNSMIEHDLMPSSALLKLSCRLDRLIVKYYKLMYKKHA